MSFTEAKVNMFLKKAFGVVFLACLLWNALEYVVIYSTDHISDSYNIYKLEKEVRKAIEVRENHLLDEQERSDAMHTHVHKAHRHNEKLRVRARRSQIAIDSLEEPLL